MTTSNVLCTPLEIEEYIKQDLSSLASVQIDPDRKEVRVLMLDCLGVPDGRQVTISTLVFKRNLARAIEAIAQETFSPQAATEALTTATPLSGWEETRITLQRRAEHEQPWWSTIASWLADGTSAIGRVVAPIAVAGGPRPPNVQTVIVALQAITAVGACIAKTFSTPAVVLSAILRVANILVVTGRCETPSFDSARHFAPTDLVIYLLALPLLSIPGPWGVIASGALASIPELAAWVRRFRNVEDPSPIACLTQGLRDPTDPQVARDVFGISEGEEVDQPSVDQAYDQEYRGLIDRITRARERGQTLVVDFGNFRLQFLNQAYRTLIGHPRTTGVD